MNIPQPAAPVGPPSRQPTHELDLPAADPATSFHAWNAQQQRLYRVAAPILLNNTPLCPDHARNIIGFTAKNKYSYSADYVDEAQKYLGLDDRLRVTEVLNGSGAEWAGIREGDILLAAGIEPIPEGELAEVQASALIASELQGRSEVSLMVLRGHDRMTFDVPLTPACAMKIDVGHSDEFTAYADGRRVMITRGMLNFVRSDGELAYVIAREVARNVLQPQLNPEEAKTIDSLRAPAVESATGVSAVEASSGPIHVNVELERLALNMLVRAGYSLAVVGNFLQRMSAMPQADRHSSSIAYLPRR
ncbi:peptidase M48 [Noviherbaspirillum sp. ST9]|uniref:peptidase M48 n=1 Tax=Noviherbaspirillum sp. ST9 TaxID=3401606 RepID=UPI003B58874A